MYCLFLPLGVSFSRVSRASCGLAGLGQPRLRGVQRSKREHLQEFQRLFTSVLEVTSMSQASHFRTAQESKRGKRNSLSSSKEECQRICTSFIPSPHSVGKKEKVLKHEVSTSWIKVYHVSRMKAGAGSYWSKGISLKSGTVSLRPYIPLTG